MLLNELLNLMEANSDTSYWAVSDDTKVWVEKGYTPSHIVNGSQMHKMTYAQKELTVDDEIHVLPGGVFFVIKDHGGDVKEVVRGSVTKPKTDSTLEKNHSGYVRPVLADLKALADKGYIHTIAPNDHTKVKYVK